MILTCLTFVVGYLHHIDAISCGRVLRGLGCGRCSSGGNIDRYTGLEIIASIGDRLTKGMSLNRKLSYKAIKNGDGSDIRL